MMNSRSLTNELKQDPLSLLLAGAIAAVILIHLTITLQIGFLSDDYALMQSAKTGTNLWTLHYSPVFKFLWECSAAGSFSAFAWHLTGWCFHLFNIFLVYLIAKNCFPLSFRLSLFAAALAAMNPAGIEALAWSCSTGYVVTATMLYSSLYFILTRSKQSTFHENLFSGIFLACIQAIAFLTWDWGIMIFPVLFIATFLINRPWKSSDSFFNLVLQLGPLCLCWLIGAFLRSTSEYSTSWQQNSPETILKFALGSPFLGLFPNFDKAFYNGPAGIISGCLLWLFLLRSSLKNKFAMAMLVSYLICIMPWVLGGNPSGRYFYIPMGFIYLILAIGFQEISYKRVAAYAAVILVAFELFFAYRRITLWQMAYAESQKLKLQIDVIAQSSADTSLIIVNMPDAYGPPGMPMRPQMWFCGLHALHPQIQLVKSRDCSYIWPPSAAFRNRNEIKAGFANKTLYEVVYKTPGDWKTFELKTMD